MQSTPIVGQVTIRITWRFSAKSSRMKRRMMEDFPTALLPSSTILSFGGLLETFIIEYILQSYNLNTLQMKYVAEKATSESGITNNGAIDWNDFNYPCCLKIFHYNPDETPEVHKRRVALYRVNHVLIIFSTFLNIITNIAATAEKMEGGGMRIGISFFIFLFWIPFSFALFILPYQIIMKDEGKPIVFYVLTIFAAIWFLIWSIANFADANGFVMIGQHFRNGRPVAGVFSIIVSVLMLLVSILNVINFYTFYKR